MSHPEKPACHCGNEPWIHRGMLVTTSVSGRYRCPETLHCLHGTTLENGRIADHWRNVPGECPWVGTKVTEHLRCACGRGPWIKLRHLRIFIRKNFTGPVVSLSCPGLCPGPHVAVHDHHISDHLRDHRSPCPWSGTRIAPIGTAPPLFVANQPSP